MERYLVESAHTAEDCKHIVEQFIVHGYIRNFDWGCQADMHTGWAVIEAVDEAQALLAVPPLARTKARAIRLCKFTPESIEEKHK